MISIDRRSLQHFDWMLLALILLIVAVGLVNLFSTTQPLPPPAVGVASEFKTQLAALMLGLVGLVVMVAMDYRRLERIAPFLYALVLLALAATIAFGTEIRGNKSWLRIGPASVQPAEFAKLGLIVMMARYFHRHPPGEMRRLLDLFLPLLILAVPVGLIILQRDTGVAVLTLAIGATYFLFVSLPWKTWALIVALAVAGAVGAWNVALKPYQRERVLSFVNAGSGDSLGTDYQAIQSRITVGSGGLTGQGWLEGPQNRGQFLPTQHSDFAFSVIAEEWGFAGSATVLGLYAVLLLWGLAIAANSKDGFGAMLAIGVVSMLLWPALINIAMVLGLAPVIGVPLPLISYGGSQMLANLVGLGLLLSVSMRRYMF
ncbi:MAG: rod shape-determining protein RodA [Deltaproteobacteria bacterium]|nr:rod shape-determining protein RodA [Deltaproteobacteria bacterium]